MSSTSMNELPDGGRSDERHSGSGSGPARGEATGSPGRARRAWLWRRGALPLLAAAVLAGCVSDTDRETESDEDVGSAADAVVVDLNSSLALSWGLVPTAPIGSIGASLHVDPTGAANYAIPIQVPPGFGGVEPKLSLRYKSSGGNGIAGVGFEVEGLSKITRCARTRAQDGIAGGVNGNADDRLCLDGQRLVPIAGAYFANGTEYRTEIDSGARIVGVGDCNTGACYFNVTSPDGTVTEIGGTPDSRPASINGGVANGPVRTWGVSKITSPAGAYMTVWYWNMGDGALYPDNIGYGMHGGAPNARLRWVKFEYEARPDVEFGYVNGAKITTTKRLSAINTYVKGAGDVLVKSYKLTYTISPDTSRSLVSKVEECDAAGVCLPPTTFDWPTEVGTDFTWAYPSGAEYQHDLRYNLGAYIIPGDFDGDGNTDFLRQEHGTWDDDFVHTFQIYYSNGGNDGTFTVVDPGDALYGLDMRADNGVNLIPGDFNGDGKIDFIRQAEYWTVNYSGYFRVYYATPWRGYFEKAEPNVADHQGSMMPSGASIIPADYNGDGKTDFFRQERGDWEGDGEHTFRVYTANNPDGVFTISEPGDQWFQGAIRQGAGAWVIPGDFNGDGKADFIRQEHGGYDNDDSATFGVYFSRGDGGFDGVYPAGSEYQENLRYDPGAQIIPGDFNGDGKTDFIRQEKSGWDSDNQLSFQVYFSRGNGYFDIVTPQGSEYQDMLRSYVASIHPLDYNGDGKTDFLRQEHGEWGADEINTFQIYISLGDGTFRVEQPSHYIYQNLMRADPGCKIIPGDFNGDGRADFIRQDTGYWADDDNFTFSVYLANGPKGGDLVKGITDGLGSKTTIEYAPLTDSTIHAAPDTPPPSGTVTARLPFYVVKSYARRDRDEPSLPDPPDAFRHQMKYVDAEIDRGGGRGFRGFSSIEDKDLGTNTTTLTKYNQDFPFAGKVKERTTTFPDGEVVTSKLTYATSSVYAEIPAPNKAPGVTRVLQTKEEIVHTKDQQSYSTTDEYEYDSFGNRALVHHRGLDGYPGDDYDTCSVFSNDAAAWHIDYLVNTYDAQACSLVPGGCDCGPPSSPTFFGGEHREYSSDGKMSVLASWQWDSAHQGWLTTSYQYDALGRVTRRTDPTGAWEDSTYDATDPGFRAAVSRCGPGVSCRGETFAIDPRFGSEAARTDENGALETHKFDGLGRLHTTEVYRDGVWTMLAVHGYWKNGTWPVRVTQQRTGWEADAPWTTESEYLDGFGRTTLRLHSAPGAADVYRTFDFDPGSGQTTWESRPFFSGSPAVGTTTTYDAQGRPLTLNDPDGTATMSYSLFTPSADCPACVAKVIVTQPPVPDANGAPQASVITRYLDAAGRTVKQVDPDGLTTLHTFDSLGRRTKVTEKSGATEISTVITYDSLGHVLSTTSPDRGTVTNTYDTRGLLTSTVDARGQTIQLYYDGLARLVEKRVFGKEDIYYEYEQSGHTYGVGRLTTVSVMGPDEPVTNTPRSRYKFSYDAEGQPATVVGYVDGVSYSLSSTFDPLGRNRTVTRDGQWTIARTYDNTGNLTGVKALDLAHPTRLLPDVTFSQHDAAGRAGKVDFANYQTDASGVAGSVVTNHTVTSYGYDAAGRLSSMLAKLGAPGSETTLMDGAYTWLSSSILTQVTETLHPAAGGLPKRTRSFGYTPAGKLAHATAVFEDAPNHNYDLGYGYDSLGRVQMGDVTDAVYGGEAAGTTPSHQLLSTAAPSGNVTYAHDAAGNRVSKQVGDVTWTYGYDGQNRLESVQKKVGAAAPVTVESYSYTFSGNRATKVDANGVKSIYLSPEIEVALFPDGRRLETVYLSGPAGRLAAFTIDKTGAAAGSPLLPFEDKLSETRLFDTRSAAGLLALARTWLSAWALHPDRAVHGAALSGLVLALALMSLAGRARSRRALSAVAAFYRRAWLARFHTRFVRRHRLYALAVPVLVASLLAGCQPRSATVDDGEDVDAADSALVAGPNGAGYPIVGANYFLNDHVGSSSVVTSSDGTLVARVQYSPFGAVYDMPGDGQDEFRSKFTGKEWDSGGELYYFGARHYDPATGQFLTPDTLLFGGPEHLTASLDPYAYAGHNPVVYTDPSGHFFDVLAVLVGVVVGAYFGAAAANGTNDPTKWDWSTRTAVGLVVGGVFGGISGGLAAVEGPYAIYAGFASGIIGSASTEALTALSPDGINAGNFVRNVFLGGVVGAFGSKLRLWSQARIRQEYTRRTGLALAEGESLSGFRWRAASFFATKGTVFAGTGAIRLPFILDREFHHTNSPSSGASGENTPNGFAGGAPQDEGAAPIETSGAGQNIDRMGQALLRASVGLTPQVALVAPLRHADTATWAAASAPR